MNSDQLPDDIEQRLLDGQPLRATFALMMRRRITEDVAREQVGRWLRARARRAGRGDDPT